MEKIRVDVVGMHHHAPGTHHKEYAATAVGRQLVLQPQPENVTDPYAVRVREGRVNVGYVAVPDLDVVYQALAGSGLQRLRGVVVETCVEPPVIAVEIEVERVDWACEPFDDSVYRGWHYDGLPLMPSKLEQLGDLTADLMDALEGTLPGGDDALEDSLQEMIAQLLDSNLYDMSREMTRARYRLQRLFAERPEPSLQEVARKLRQQKGQLMRHMYRDQVARYLFIELPTLLRQQGLEESHYTYDNRLDELEQQLRAFPWQLYDKFLSDPVDFLREVYYKHVPRRYLFPLLSGIVLMILKGRVKIARWGREGDTEPIERIESLTPDLNPSERKEMMKSGIRELLSKRDAQGNFIVSQKNQWAAILSILTFDYGVESTDLRDLCRQMDAWGFGKQSAYACFCDYESVSKCSEYANRAFSDWRGAGIAHKRQVLAAIELRAILRPRIGYR